MEVTARESFLEKMMIQWGFERHGGVSQRKRWDKLFRRANVDSHRENQTLGPSTSGKYLTTLEFDFLSCKIEIKSPTP